MGSRAPSRVDVTDALNGAEAARARALERHERAQGAHTNLVEALEAARKRVADARATALGARTPADRMQCVELLEIEEAALAELDGADAHRVRCEYGTAQTELEKAEKVYREARKAFERAVCA